MSDERVGDAASGIAARGKAAMDQASNAASEAKTKAGNMVDTAKDTAREVGDDVKSEIASLREQVKKLMDERVTPALSSVAETASSYASQARDTVSDGAVRASTLVKENPLYAVGIVAAIGVLIGCAIAARPEPRPWYSPDRYR